MEACVEYVQSAINAEKGGAIRLELCSALSEGGLTPSVGLLRRIKDHVKIPVYVMIRPRTGNDFIYSDDELIIMENDIKSLDQNGADGFVFGILNSDSTIDKKSCQRLFEKVNNKPVTFHRAFDMTSNPKLALEDIIALGFSNVLTSGQKENAELGAELIKELIDLANSRINIIPGCGVNANNLLNILKNTNAKLFHGTARSAVKLAMPNKNVTLGHVEDESVIYITDVEKVKQMVNIYNKCQN